MVIIDNLNHLVDYKHYKVIKFDCNTYKKVVYFMNHFGLHILTYAYIHILSLKILPCRLQGKVINSRQQKHYQVNSHSLLVSLITFQCNLGACIILDIILCTSINIKCSQYIMYCHNFDLSKKTKMQKRRKIKKME